MVLRVKFCGTETGPLPVAIPGGRPRLQEAGLSGESKWLPELPWPGGLCSSLLENPAEAHGLADCSRVWSGKEASGYANYNEFFFCEQLLQCPKPLLSPSMAQRYT